MKKLSDFLKINEDGSMSITLSKPLKIAGDVSATELRMREPTVDDNLYMEALDGGEITKETKMMAHLCGLTFNDMRPMPNRDYRRLQSAYTSFID